jgi:hypothetical protein
MCLKNADSPFMLMIMMKKYSFNDIVKCVKSGVYFARNRKIRDIDLSVDQLQHGVILSHYQNCPAKSTRSPRMTPWLNKKLSAVS